MSQARRAFVVLVSIVAFILGFAPSAFAQNRAAVVTQRAAPAVHSATTATPIPGYWVVARDGGILSSGGAVSHGSASAAALNRPIVGMAATPSGAGYWMVASDGGIFSFGNATFHGSTGAMTLNSPIVGMASTVSGNGYWLVAADGGIFSFGDAVFHGSTGAMKLNMPIVGMAATPTGHGYWLVASDGGIFSFGDAAFHGSTGAMTLNMPIVGMAATHSGNGYWFVASDGGIFSFGDAVFHGSTGAIKLNQPIVGMASTPSGNGYWFVAADGGIFSFGDAHFLAPTAPASLTASAVGMAASAPTAAPALPPATSLSVTTNPSASTGGLPFATQPVVHVLDADGATVTDATNPVTLSIAFPQAGTTLTCDANPVAAIAGIATFAGCRINIAGNYTLDVESGALTPTTTSATITIGPAAKAGFTVEPSGGANGAPFAPSPTVAIQDAGGNTIVAATTITLSINAPANGGVLACTNAGNLTAAAPAGVATFTGCSITGTAGTRTLHATNGTFSGNSSNVVTTAGAATQVVFTTAPVFSGVNGATFAPSPTATVEDVSGNTVAAAASVVLSVNGTATLACTNAGNLTFAAPAGVAAFTGCTLTGAVGPDTITATSGGHTVTSGSLNITS